MRRTNRLTRLRPEDDRLFPAGLLTPSQFIALVGPAITFKRWSAWFDRNTGTTHIRRDVTMGDRWTYYNFLTLSGNGGTPERVVAVTFASDVQRETFMAVRQRLELFVAHHGARLDLSGGRHFVTEDDDATFPTAFIKPSRLWARMVEYLDPKWELLVAKRADGPDDDESDDLELLYAAHEYHYFVGGLVLPTPTRQCQLRLSVNRSAHQGMVELLKILLHNAKDDRGLRLDQSSR